MSTIVDVLLSDIEKSISNFGTGWSTALCLRVFYQLQKNGPTRSTWESVFKSRLAVVAPNAQPAVTVVPASAIGAHAEAVLGVCIQAVK
jgi:hypothetical protein